MPILMGMKFLKAHSQHLAMPEPSYYVIAKSSWFCMVWTSFPPQWQSTSKIWPNLALMLITHTCINSNNFANTASYQLNKLSSTSPTFSPNMRIKDYTTIWRGKGEAANAERLWQYRAASVNSKQKLWYNKQLLISKLFWRQFTETQTENAIRGWLRYVLLLHSIQLCINKHDALSSHCIHLCQ